MGMWTTENQDTLDGVLKGFSKAAYMNYNDHAFEAGYLQSLAVQMLKEMPKRKQEAVIEDMIRALRKQEQQFIEKILENKTFDRVEGSQ